MAQRGTAQAVCTWCSGEGAHSWHSAAKGPLWPSRSGLSRCHVRQTRECSGFPSFCAASERNSTESVPSLLREPPLCHIACAASSQIASKSVRSCCRLQIDGMCVGASGATFAQPRESSQEALIEESSLQNWRAPLHSLTRAANAAAEPRPRCVVALGKFDAMHLGHRSLVERAAGMGDEPWLISFDGMAAELGALHFTVPGNACVCTRTFNDCHDGLAIAAPCRSNQAAARVVLSSHVCLRFGSGVLTF